MAAPTTTTTRWRPPAAPPGGYFDPHAALADGLAVPIVFTAGARGVGALVAPGAGAADVPPGAPADVPLWLAAALLDRNMARLANLPNTIVSPHVAFLTGEALNNIAQTTLDNLHRSLATS
jgi:hypothetical protein